MTRCSFTIGIIALFIMNSSAAQSPKTQQDLPKGVVEKLCSMDAGGGRLTTKGWYEAASLFVKPSKPLNDMVIEVFKGSVYVGNADINGDNATVGIEYLSLGRIDSALRFGWGNDPPSPIHSRGFYTLILSDKHWIFRRGQGELIEVTGAKEWRIKDFEPCQLISLETAIRYVKERRDKSNDPVVKRNADKTLAALDRLR